MNLRERRLLPDHISKRHPLLDPRTGQEAAEIYRSRHPRMGLRQLSRYLRIKAGLRPLVYDVPGKRERKTLACILRRKSQEEKDVRNR